MQKSISSLPSSPSQVDPSESTISWTSSQISDAQPLFIQMLSTEDELTLSRFIHRLFPWKRANSLTSSLIPLEMRDRLVTLTNELFDELIMLRRQGESEEFEGEEY